MSSATARVVRAKEFLWGMAAAVCLVGPTWGIWNSELGVLKDTLLNLTFVFIGGLVGLAQGEVRRRRRAARGEVRDDVGRDG